MIDCDLPSLTSHKRNHSPSYNHTHHSSDKRKETASPAPNVGEREDRSMPDTAPTPEETAEQTARRVVERYGWIQLRLILLWALMFGILWTGWLKAFHRSQWFLILSGSLLLYGGSLAFIYWSSMRGMRRFTGSLSHEERAALQTVLARGSVQETAAIKEILKYTGETVPEKEYVRASSAPEQPDTLLRAAQPSAETAPEQLLRPTQQ